MKAKFVIGMAALAVSMLGTVGHAATPAVKKAIVEKTKEITDHNFGAGVTTLKGLSAQAASAAQNRTIQKLELPSRKAQELSNYVRDPVTQEATLRTVNVVIAAKEVAPTLANPAEAAALKNAANAVTQVLVNARSVGSRPSSKELSTEQMAIVSGALKVAEGLSESVIKEYSVKEQEAHAAVFNKYGEIVDSNTKPVVEEALVEAVIIAKKYSDDVPGTPGAKSAKEKAIELLEKFMKCLNKKSV